MKIPMSNKILNNTPKHKQLFYIGAIISSPKNNVSGELVKKREQANFEPFWLNLYLTWVCLSVLF